MSERVNYRVRSVKVGAKPLFFRLEHACGNFGDETAGDEAVRRSDQGISEGRDDVTFSDSQGLQTGVGVFFLGFNVSFLFFLSSNTVLILTPAAPAKRQHP